MRKYIERATSVIDISKTGMKSIGLVTTSEETHHKIINSTNGSHKDDIKVETAN